MSDQTPLMTRQRVKQHHVEQDTGNNSPNNLRAARNDAQKYPTDVAERGTSNAWHNFNQGPTRHC